MIGEDELAQLEGGYLINCARGGIVDEDALAEAVDDGILAGAALDSFAEEPLSQDSPLLDVEDIVLTPHLGAPRRRPHRRTSPSTPRRRCSRRSTTSPYSRHSTRPPSTRPRSRGSSRTSPPAETAGKVAAQLLDGRITGVETTYEGDIAEEDVDLVTASALKGVFEPLVVAGERGERASARRTRHRGHRVEDPPDRGLPEPRARHRPKRRRRDRGRGNAVRRRGRSDRPDRRVPSRRPVPYGHMLVARNTDEPGVIGLIGTVLGDYDVNIAGIQRQRPRDAGRRGAHRLQPRSGRAGRGHRGAARRRPDRRGHRDHAGRRRRAAGGVKNLAPRPERVAV